MTRYEQIAREIVLISWDRLVKDRHDKMWKNDFLVGIAHPPTKSDRQDALIDVIAQAIEQVIIDDRKKRFKIKWPSQEASNKWVEENGSQHKSIYRLADAYRDWLRAQARIEEAVLDDRKKRFTIKWPSKNCIEAEAAARFGSPTLTSEAGVHWCRYKDSFKQGVEWFREQVRIEEVE